MIVTRMGAGTDGGTVHISFQGSDDELRVMSSIHNPRSTHMMAMGGCHDDDCGGCGDAACGHHHEDDDVEDDNGAEEDDASQEEQEEQEDRDDELGPGVIILGPSVLQLFDAEHHRVPASALTLELSKTLCELGICKVVRKKTKKQSQK